MQYWLTVFNKTTWKQFREMREKVCAYNAGRYGKFPNIEVGDCLVCYVAGKASWAGVVSVSGKTYRDLRVIYDGGLFPIRVPVREEATVDSDDGVRMASLEGRISFFPEGASPKQWAAHVRRSPRKIDARDGEIIALAVRKAADSLAKRESS